LLFRGHVSHFSACAVLLAAALMLFAGCGRKKRAPAVPAAPSPGWTETGIASWYGNPYHGRRTSSGEVFDMNQMTAAHRTLPFGAMVKVTNLDNRKTVSVRINDRGPFVEGRIIDLSRAAAKEIGLIGPGTARVRIELTGYANPEAANQPPLFTIQAGAFTGRADAERYRERLRKRYEPVDIVASLTPPGTYRIFVGRFGGQREAEEAAEQMRREVKEVFVVRIR
jgi:rare lipoprotein A